MKRTTLVLDEALLDEATRLCGAKTWSGAVQQALQDFVRRAKAGRILELRTLAEPTFTSCPSAWQADCAREGLTPDSWLARDARGSTFRFQRVSGEERWYLTNASDVDRNMVRYGYTLDGNGALLESIRYNNYSGQAGSTGAVGDSGLWATQVLLAYGNRQDALGYAPADTLNSEARAGAVVRHTLWLTGVSVQNKTTSTWAESLRYVLAYRPAAESRLSLLESIAVVGADGVQHLPATQFSYADGGSDQTPNGYYALSPPTETTLPAEVRWAGVYDDYLKDVTYFGARWLDLDGDGRPDLVWDYKDASGVSHMAWLRNQTSVGASSLTLGPPVTLAGSDGFTLDGVVSRRFNCDPTFFGTRCLDRSTQSGVMDFNGDGVPDLVRVIGDCPVYLPNDYPLEVRLGSVVRDSQGVRVDYGLTGLCVGTRDVKPSWDAVLNTGLPILPFGIEAQWDGNVVASLADVNGDRLQDYVIRAGDGWHLFQSWTFQPARVLSSDIAYGSAPVNGLPVTVSPPYVSARDFAFLDLDGDGVGDQVLARGFEYVQPGTQVWPDSWKTWHVARGGGPSFALARVGTSAVEVPWTWPAGVPQRLQQFGQARCAAPTCPDGWSLVPWDMPDDPSQVLGAVLDLNGDGLPDHVRNGSGGFAVNWNAGSGFATGPVVPTPLGLGGFVARSPAKPPTCTWLCEDPAGLESRYKYTSATFWTGHAGFVDLNADGVADYAQIGGSVVFYPGTNGRDTGQPILLRAVTTPTGATYSLEYAPASRFGASGKETARSVVTKVRVTGPRMAPNATSYWYEEPATGRRWYEYGGTRSEPRGFRRSFSQDDATRIVRATTWEVGSYPFNGTAAHFELGTPDGTATTTGRPGYRVFRRLENSNAWRGLAGGTPSPGCGAASQEPGAYPVIPFTQRSSTTHFLDGQVLSSSANVACADVDAYGNSRKVKVDPDGARAGDEYYRHSTFDAGAACKSCPVETKTTSDEAGTLLLQRTGYFYDSPTGTYDMPLAEGSAGTGHLNYAMRRVMRLDKSPQDERESATAYNGNGTVATVVRFGDSAFTESLLYDAYQLRVVRRTLSDPAGAADPRTLVTDMGYDDQGRVVRQVGPYLGTDPTTTPRPSLSYAYDGIGRLLATARSIQGATVTGALAANEYPSADRVVSYRFAAPKSFTLGAIPQDGDVIQSIAYLDGLGRTVQLRERLGGWGRGTTAAVEATGFRVASAVRFDGAGRATASLEPFYSLTDAYEDFGALASQSGRRGSLSSFDAEGRIACALTGVYAALEPNAASCTSSLADDAQHRLAIAYRYRGEPWKGRAAGVVRVVPPQSASGRGSDAYYDAGNRLVATVDASGGVTETLYGILGWPEQSYRQAPGGELQLVMRNYYDSLGRPYRQVNGSAEPRELEYNALGQVTRVKLPAGAGEVRDIVYEYGSLGRKTRAYYSQTVTGPLGTSVETGSDRRYGYDVPLRAELAYTAGRLAWADEAGKTNVAFGYDEDGAPVRREQSLAAIAGSRFVAWADLGNDGRLVQAGLEYGLAANAVLTSTPAWRVDYDTAGRSVRVASAELNTLQGAAVVGEHVFWQVGGSYDALGRIDRVRSNHGTVETVRSYSPYTGALASHFTMLTGTALYGAGSLVHVGTKLRSYTDEAGQTSYQFGYDDDGRLTSARATGNGTNPVGQSYDQSFVFNGGDLQNVTENLADGSRLEKVYKGGDRPSAIDFTRTAAGVVTQWSHSFVYDRDGNRKARGPLGPDGAIQPVESFDYDLDGRLVSLARGGGREQLGYDPFGALLSRQVGSDTIYYVGVNATVTVGPWGTKVEEHVALGGLRLATVGEGRVLYYHRDRQGTVVATTVARKQGGALAAGFIGARWRYTPYGEVDRAENVTAESASELGYTGALMLTGGLVHLQARVYDPQVGKFLQADTVDAQRYAYAAGDPINFVDPTGRAVQVFIGGVEVPWGMAELYMRTFYPEQMPGMPWNLFMGGLLHDARVDFSIQAYGARIESAKAAETQRPFAGLQAGPGAGPGHPISGEATFHAWCNRDFFQCIAEYPDLVSPELVIVTGRAGARAKGYTFGIWTATAAEGGAAAIGAGVAAQAG